MPTDKEIEAATEAITRQLVMQRREEYKEWNAKEIAKAALEAAEQVRGMLDTHP